MRRGSHKRIRVTCDFGVAPKCRGHWEIEQRLADESRARNDGKIICIYCSRQLKSTGRSNPNCRYAELDDTFFATVDTEAKAYLLGWIASDGSITQNSLAIYIHEKDENALRQLRDAVCSTLPLKPKKNTPLIGLTINAKAVVADVCRWLKCEPRKKSGVVGFPDLANDALKWAFVRGVFDGDGHVSSIEAATKRSSGKEKKGWPAPRCGISNNSKALLDEIRTFAKIPAYQGPDVLAWTGSNALDFLGKIYDGASIYLSRKRDLYLDWCAWMPVVSRWMAPVHPLFKWSKVHPSAVAPSKEFASDSGFDLTLLEKTKEHGMVEFFRTGIRVQPAFGWYFDVVPRSSISKTGYMLANGVGVIDRAYVGEILVPLIKIDPNAAPIQLPARLVQMIPRQIVHAHMVEVAELESTARGDGGFGSTNK